MLLRWQRLAPCTLTVKKENAVASPNPIIRVLTLANQTLFVTGFEGFAPGECLIPAGTRILPGEKTYADVARLDLSQAEPRQTLVYLGLTRASRDFTCYMRTDGKSPQLLFGLYQGDGAAPAPLDDQYGYAKSFTDGLREDIWQYQLSKLPPFPAAHARLQPLVEGAVFAGDIFQLKYQLPKLVMGAIVRGSDGSFASTVLGWGGKDCLEPDARTLVPLGSITKAFTGHLLARMVVKGEARFTTQVVQNPAIRLIDLVTHTSGLPREVSPDIGLEAPEPEELPSVLFPPGTGALYSNVGFNALSRALVDQCNPSRAASFYELLKQEVLAPLQLEHTSYNAPPWKVGCTDDRTQNLFGGYHPDGKPWHMADEGKPTHDSTPRGASGLYSTPGDLLRWLQWHLEVGGSDTETRLLNHATYVQRDGLHPVLGLDESGHMDAMGLGWVVMMPRGDRPFILQKAGATRGVFNYLAFSPVRGVGFFMSVDRFDVGAATEMPQMINDLIASAAPR
ncbi:hypothetical protein D7Y21_10615 [Corallococcus sp. AB045]|nr:hypothetical protein D7Y21_10615 [Corallococcus sp. AB045]